MKLYDMELSGNCYKIRLLCALLGLQYESVPVNFNRLWNIFQCQEFGKQGLAMLENHLSSNEWLVDARPSLADIACYPYVALAPEGGVSLSDYPDVQRWTSRIQSLPGYVGMPGI